MDKNMLTTQGDEFPAEIQPPPGGGKWHPVSPLPTGVAWTGADAGMATAPGNVDFESPLISALSIVSGILGRPISAETLRSGLPQGKERLSTAAAIRAAERAGIRAKTFFRRSVGEITSLTLPCILLLKNNNACVLTGLAPGEAEVIFPEAAGVRRKVQLPKLQGEYSGYAIFTHLEGRLDKRVGDLRLVDTKEWFWGTIFRFLPIYKHVVLATMVVNLLAIAGPLFVMNVYDRVVPNNAIDTLWVLALGVGMAYGFDFLLRNLRGYFVDVAGKNADVIIASKLMQQLTSMRLDYKPDSAGALANNLREFESLREFFSSTTLLGLVDIPFILIFISLIAYIGGPLAWAPAVAVPVVVLVGIFLQYPFQRIIEKGYRESAQKNALIIEAISGLETIKTSLAEGQIQKQWERFVGMSARSTSHAKALANLSITFFQFVTHLVSLIIIIGGVYLIARGELTLGGLIACNILVGRALAPLGSVAGMLTRLQQSRMALKSLDLLMRVPNESPPDKEFLRHQQIEPSVTLEQVGFQYPGAQVMAVRDLSLQVGSGEKVGIIGRTGSGKSTLGRLCLGLYQPHKGTVKVGGFDIRQLHVADLRSRIGYVGQDNFLFYGTIRDNIAFGNPHADERSILRAADIAGVTEFARAHPAGFDCQVGERGMSLSGGQRQAVAIARALLLDPDILILDEPTSAMDNASEMLLRERLAQETGSTTLILLTHRSSMLALVDRLVVMDSGKIMADGPKEKILEALKNGEIRVAYR